MKYLKSLLFASTLALSTGSAAATTLLHSDLNSFLANSSNLTKVDFNGVGREIFHGNDEWKDGLNFTGSWGVFTTYAVDYDAPYHIDGYLSLQGIGRSISFAESITALSFDFGAFYYDAPTVHIGLNNGDNITISGSYGQYAYFGITSNVAFNSFTIDSTNPFVTIDNLRFGSSATEPTNQIPEPASLALLIFGLVGMAGYRRAGIKTSVNSAMDMS